MKTARGALCVYVLLDTRQALPIARLDSPDSYFNLNISLIFALLIVPELLLPPRCLSG